MSGEPGVNGPLDFIEKKKRELQRELNAAKIVVALLGASGEGLEERRSMAEELSRNGIMAIIPEDILPTEVAPSLLEKRILADKEVDLAFVNVESWGSVAEFSEFRTNHKIAPKLRVLAERDHHPLYSSSKSYVSDVYLMHDAVFGHIYMYRRKRNAPVEEWVPTSRELVMTLADRYRQWKALG